MKVTVQTVAEHARVSVGTVSRVLNSDPSVSLDMSRKVNQCIQELGYVPLRRRKQRNGTEGISGKTIGLLTLGMDRSLSRLPVVTAAVDGIREAAFEAGAALQLFDAPDPGAKPDWIRRTGCDAWLIKGAMQGNSWSAAHDSLKQVIAAVPCVWFHGQPRSAPGWSVGGNDWEAGALAASYLHEKGHRRVAFLSPKNRHSLLKRRQHGFAATCEELGMSCRTASRDLQNWSFPLERPKSLAAVETLVDEVMNKGDRYPTAIFVPADSVAVLLYRVLAERGLRIPDEISVISVNREEGLIAGLFPTLTTIDIRSAEVGREAVGLLARQFASDRLSARQDLLLEPELVPGDSVAVLETGSTR